MAETAAADASASTPPTDTPLPQLVIELREMVVGYVRQETVQPIKQLGRYVLFGVLGSMFLGLGVVLLGIGGLRALQTETGDTFAGDWSWAPYGITVVALMVGGTITWKVRDLSRTRAEKRAFKKAEQQRKKDAA